MKPLLTIFLLLISLIGYSQPQSSIEFGYQDRYVSMQQIIKGDLIHVNSAKYFRHNLYINYDIGVRWNRLSLYGSVKTYFTPDYSRFNFKPLQAEYTTGVRYNISKFELKYEHFCSHSIDGYIFRDGYDKVSIRYELWKK